MHVNVRRAAGMAALAAPAMMWALFLLTGLTRQGYNLLTRPFSDLATFGTPDSVVFDLGFFLVPGLLTIALGIGLLVGVRGGGRAWRAGAGLVLAAGVFLFATGVFRQDPNSPLASPLHGTVSQICFALASAAPLVLFIGAPRHLRARAPRAVWLAAGVAAFAIEAGGVLLRSVISYPYGFFQRPFTFVLTIWFVTTGAWLLSDRRFEGLSVPD